MRILIAFGLLLLSLSGLQAQILSQGLSSDRVKIGEEFFLEISVDAPKEELNFTEFKDSSGIELRNIIIDSTKIGQTGIKYSLISFDTGYVYVLPQEIFIGNKSYSTDAMALKIDALKIKEDSEYLDIKKNLDAPFDWERFLIILAIVLLVVGLIFLLSKWLKGRKRKEKFVEEVVIEISPIDKAKEELRSLQQSDLWNKEEPKEYYSELIDIYRRYLEGIGEIKALEMTMNELLDNLSNDYIDNNEKGELSRILNATSLIKYAKGKTHADQHLLDTDVIEKLILKHHSIFSKTQSLENE